MKYLDEYRDAKKVQLLAQKIKETAQKSWTLMEICGGQTHTIVKYRLDELLPTNIKLVHGPGCPVCVTPIEKINRAIAISSLPNVIFTSFGDMLRVPGSKGSLWQAKATGADVRIVYSPLDALSIAEKNPDKQVVFFGVGFETTAPANAMTLIEARKRNLKNFSMLVSHVLVPPAVEALLSSPENRLDGFLAAGHVCTVMGLNEYKTLSEKFHVPFIATGFEPTDIMHGILLAIETLEKNKYDVINQYSRSIQYSGNLHAREAIFKVFQIVSQKWRGIGEIPNSGLDLKEEWREFDAMTRFEVNKDEVIESPLCKAGAVLQGLMRPNDCSAFGELCTPESPLGAPMVSSEGACAAYFRYKRNRKTGG